MGDEARFSEKWDFRRKESNLDDSSGDDPDSNSTQDPIIHNPNHGTETVSRDQPVKTRKRRSKKDESKPEKAKQVRRRKPKTVPGVDKGKEEEEMVIDGVGTFMETLFDDLKASREGLMDWVKAELYGTDQNVASKPPLKKRVQRSVNRKTKTKKKKAAEEEKEKKEKQSKPDENGPEMNKAKEKSAEISQNVPQLDSDALALDMFLKSGQDGLGKNYFQQQQETLVERAEVENSENTTVKNQKSIVLAIEAQNLSRRQKKTREANTIKKRSRTRSESQKDHNFATPFAPELSPPLQCFPVASSLNSFFPSSGQGTTPLASNNFQLKPPLVSQIPDLPEFQTGFTGGQGFGNSLSHNNGYFSGFPTGFQPNLIPGGFNFPAQVNPATSSQQREEINAFGGPIRFSGNRFPQAEFGNINNSLFDYRTGSGR